MQNHKKIIIIGGGVIGLCCAYSLQKEGHEVTIIEKGSIGNEASLGNAGNISPSYFMPLPSAGILKKGIQWLFVPESPLGMRFRLDIKFYIWLLKFASYCTARHTKNVKKTLADLTMSSYKMYDNLSKMNEIDFAFNKKGRLIVCNTEKGLASEKHVREMGRELGLDSKVLTKVQVEELNPGIDIDIKGAIFYEDNAHIVPKEFMSSMQAYLMKNGVTIYENCEVTDFKKDNNIITSIHTSSKGEISADEFVLAAGAWAQGLGEALDVNLNIEAAKGYSVLVKDEKYKLNVPMTLSEGKAIVTPSGDETLFGGTLELSSLDRSINQRKISGILKSMKYYIKDFKEEDIPRDKIWVGFRPCSVDGLPIIGKHKSCSNMTYATGHGMMGLTLAPITGKLVNEIISDKILSYPLDQITPNRF